MPRVILGSPVAGVAKDEIVDGTPAIEEILKRHLLDPAFSNLPRKFKSAISGSPRLDVAHEINDVSFVGVVHPEQGWGRADETFGFMTEARRQGAPDWFALGDRDLVVHVERTRRLAEGERLSVITAEFAERFGVASRLLPMSVAPRPPVVRPPRYLVGLTMTAVLPIRAACTAAAMPPDVPPNMQRSASTTWAGAVLTATKASEHAKEWNQANFMRGEWQRRVGFQCLRRWCGREDSRPVQPPPCLDEEAFAKLGVAYDENFFLHRGKGCTNCRDSGCNI